MASYNELNALIDAYINQNGVQAITGQILNGVLKAMVEQLGRGYAIMGAATPMTDPGTPDAPECYFASETGTYTDFDGLQVVPGELALLCYTPNDGWTKNTIYEGFQTVGATIDGNVGTPSVGVSYANGVLSFDFHNMKGNTGDPAGFGTIGATVDGNIGTPGVSVSESGPDTAKNLTFAFTNLKGETGVTSVVATVDNTSGNPSCTVSLVGQQLTLAFSGLKGAQGDTGVSADYPIAIVNNLTTNDPASALSAAQGVVLEGEVSQLRQELTETERTSKSVNVTTTAIWTPAFFPEKIPSGTVITGISGFDVGFYFCDSNGTYFQPLIRVNSTTFPITLEQDAYGITSNPAQSGTIYYETIKTIKRLDRLEDEVSDLQDEVSEIDELIDGHTPATITESVNATQSGSYNQYLFAAIMPSGSVIRSVNTNGVACYLLREDDTYNPTLIANLTLPYTTGENYKGILANGVGTVVITYDDGVATEGFDERLTAVEEEAEKIDEIDGIVNGEQAESPLSVNTLASYTEVLFDTPIPQGAIISAFTKSDSSLFFYLTDENGNYDVNINSNTLKTALPYTTTKKYRGIKATAVGSVSFDFWGELGVASARKCVFVRKTDTELQLLDKMRYAFFAGNVDVFFETAEYVLKNIYTYMRDVLGWTWTMGLPIGNGCRYFFNNSTLISQAPENYSDDRNILDNRTSATDLEVHDVVLKMEGTGTYCIHDETSGNATPYSHIYENVTCYQGNATRCVGIGTGFDSSLVFRDCNFFTTSNDACGIHGPSSNPNSLPVKLSFEEDACFVSDGASPFSLGSAYFDASRDSIVVRLSNSRFTRAIDQTTSDLIGTFMSWGNNL